MHLKRVILALLLLSSSAAAQPSLQVEIGWDGAYRLGRWTPIFVTASDSKPRNVLVELYAPHDNMHAMRIEQTVAIGPAPVTIVLFAPMVYEVEAMSVTLRDAGSRRRVADWTSDEIYQQPRSGSAEPVAQLVAVSGRAAPHSLLARQLGTNNLAVRSLDPLRLPAQAIGYDAVNVLMLDQPDLSRLSLEQQQAIIDWVRAGGKLICWMGEDALPTGSALLAVLPATVGENVVHEVPADAVEQAGLQRRFTKLKGRRLTPLPGAKEVALFGGALSGWQWRLGFGSVMLLPADVSSFLFTNEASAVAFWKPLIADAVTLRQPGATDTAQPTDDGEQQRRTAGVNQTMELLGNVPGTAHFGFTYVAAVMLTLMLVVGPVDWIVLKKLGRQPWTWLTTSGWIAAVTIAGILLGYVVKGGDLHYRTLRIIDQADDMTVATTDALGIYSPRTQEYQLQTDRAAWWEPLAVQQYFSRGMKIDVPFHQDYAGTRPQKLRINVWSLRMLMSQTNAPAPPMLQASLRRENGRLVGSVTNLASVPLSNMTARLSGATCVLTAGTLEPGATLNINSPLQDGDAQFRFDAQIHSSRIHGYTQPITQLTQCADLATDRAISIDRLLDADRDLVCVYAHAEGPATAATVQLVPPPDAQSHWQFVRAIFPLQAKP